MPRFNVSYVTEARSIGDMLYVLSDSAERGESLDDIFVEVIPDE